MVLQSRVTAPDWTDDEGGGLDGARCRVFQITRDDDGIVRNDTWYQDAEEAMSVCNGAWPGGTPCPMRGDCLFIGLINNDHGVWGGLTEPQRRWVRRNIPRSRWNEQSYIHEQVPAPDHFKDYGNENPDEEAAK